MLKKVFFGLSGGFGPVFRTLPIANKLKKRGYEVHFSVYGEYSAKYIEQKGYKHIEDDDPMYPDPSKIIPSSTHFYHLDHYFAQLGLLDEHFVESWIKHRIKMLKDITPNLVFADMSPHTIIAARYLGIPSLSLTQSCFHPNGQSFYIPNEIPRNIPKVSPIVNRVLQRLGLPDIQRMEELNQGDIDFVAGFPEFDPINSKKVKYVGHIEYDLPPNVRLQLKNINSYILVYPGRLQDGLGESGLRILNIIKNAFSGTDQNIVVASNEAIPEAWKRDLSKNITLISHFNNEILENAQLFIHHGGHGSCLSAIKVGIPSLIIPTHSERLFNAKKIHQLGLGDYMLPDTIISEYLFQMSQFMINDEYRSQVAKFKRMINSRNYRGAEQVINILESEGFIK